MSRTRPGKLARLNALFGLYAAIVALSVTGLVALPAATDDRCQSLPAVLARTPASRS